MTKQIINDLQEGDNRQAVNDSAFAQEDLYNGLRPEYVDSLYNAVKLAETGHLSDEDSWIRTQATGTGSSAYGPVQINRAALTSEYYNDIGFSPEVDKWIQDKYIPQMDLFLEYGGSDMIPGMERYDYGARGDFTVEDREMYEKMAKKLISHQYTQDAKSNLNEFITSWRGRTEEQDPRYYEEVRVYLGE